jgi:hypothetical protein
MKPLNPLEILKNIKITSEEFVSDVIILFDGRMKIRIENDYEVVYLKCTECGEWRKYAYVDDGRVDFINGDDRS